MNSDLRLRYYPDSVLKTVCRECRMPTDEIQSLGSKMLEIMFENNGYGLSANQVGVTTRLFVMRDPENENLGLIFPNPTIEEYGTHKELDFEGCLSLPMQRTKLERFKRVEFTFDDIEEPGERKQWSFEGVNARCVQHELDHLNGILLFDHIKSNLSQKSFLERYAKDMKQARRKGKYL